MKSKRTLTLFVAILMSFTLMTTFIGCGKKNKNKGCNHNWTEATCTEPSYCTRCNKINGAPAGHRYVDSEIAATCDSEGHIDRECSVCHDKTSEVLPRLAHKYTSQVTDTLTCEADEVTTYTCTLCNEAYSETTKRHAGHDTAGAVWTVKSETEGDNDCEYIVCETAKCKTCKEDMERTYHKHVYTPVIVDATPATCKAAGVIAYSCICEDPKYDFTEELPINPAAHVWTAVSRENATHECDVCGATKSEILISGSSATIAAEALNGKNNVAIKSDNGVTLQADAALTQKMSGGVKVSAETTALPSVVTGEDAEKLQGATIYNFELSDGDDNKIDFGTGKMTVSVPYTDNDADDDPMSVFACHITDEGKLDYIPAVYSNGVATFEAEHFSHYSVVRLTAKERCAKLGHNETVITVAATCTEDGYTVKSCKRCGNFDRIPGANKTGHEYVPTVVAPTCTGKGYTLMACKHAGCDDAYVTKYTAVVPHSYTDTKVDATCTAKGYTEHTCDKCGASYRDRYTDITAHSYTNGVCRVCGKLSNASANGNFYINLINSLSGKEFYFDISDANVIITFQVADTSENIIADVELGRILVRLDDDGYLVGSGEGKAKITMAQNNGAPTTSAEVVSLAFKDKKIYMRMTDTYSRAGTKEVYERYSVMSQDDAGLGMVMQYIKALNSDPAKKIAGILLDGNAKDSLLNNCIAKIMDYLFDKSESAGGYTLTLNYDHLSAAVEYASSHNTAEVFDAIVGDGKFDAVVEFIKDLPEMTLGDFVVKAAKNADAFGLDINDIYDLIDAVFKAISPDSTIDALQYVVANSDKLMPDVVEELSGGAIDADGFVAIIDDIVATYMPVFKDKNVSFIEAVASFVPVDSEVDGEEFDFAGFVKSSLDSLIAAADNTVSVVIATDNSGAFESLSIRCKDLDYTQELPAAFMGEEGSISVKGSFNCIMTTVRGAINNNSDIVAVISKAQTDYVSAVKKNVGKQFESDYSSIEYTVVEKDGKYALVPYIDSAYINKYSYALSPVGNGTYNGNACNVYSYYTRYSSNVLRFDGYYSYSNSCSGWTRSTVSASYYDNSYFKVYKQGNEILGIEYDWEGSASDSDFAYDDSTAYMFVNVAQGKITLKEPHKYVLVEKGDEPTECEQITYDKYRCTVCGSISYEYHYNWHKYTYSYELKSGASDCAGGVIEIAKCTVCGKESRSEISGVDSNGNHRVFSMDHPIADAECTDTYVVVYGCICGKNVRDVRIVSRGQNGCRFEMVNDERCSSGECTHGYAVHRITSYQCFISKCGYTYTEEYVETAPNSECVATYKTIYTLKNGTKYETNAREVKRHSTISKETTEGALRVITEVCKNCDMPYEVEKLDEYGREVYYYSYEDEYGRERIYDSNCHYVTYHLDRDGNRVGQMDSGVHHEYGSASYEPKVTCTQPHDKTCTCLVCSHVETTDYFYGHNFVYQGDRYVCEDCGLTNDIYVDGPVVLENLSTDGVIIIGYYNRYRGFATDIELYADYDDGVGDIITNVNYDDQITSSQSGILIIDTDDMAAWLDNNPGGTFTVVFTVDERYVSDDEHYNTLEFAITLTAEELSAALGA